jgi:hypothetical protein
VEMRQSKVDILKAAETKRAWWIVQDPIAKVRYFMPRIKGEDTPVGCIAYLAYPGQIQDCDPVVFGYSVCSADDMFDRFKGKMLALSRLKLYPIVVEVQPKLTIIDTILEYLDSNMWLDLHPGVGGENLNLAAGDEILRREEAKALRHKETQQGEAGFNFEVSAKCL